MAVGERIGQSQRARLSKSGAWVSRFQRDRVVVNDLDLLDRAEAQADILPLAEPVVGVLLSITRAKESSPPGVEGVSW